jgi:NADH-quinone oxidoreductase subunit M
VGALAIIGIIYCALLALIQPNLKRLIAYSSVSHLGFVVLGIFSFSQEGADGAVYQMIAHGISTGALFIMVGYLEQRRGTLEIAEFGGLATPAPTLATVFMIATLASLGLPILCNFVGEFLLLQGAAIAKFSWAAWAAIGVILSAAYMLWMYQRTFLGRPADKNFPFTDLTASELLPILPMVVLMVWLGTFTQSFMPPITSATARLLDQTSLSNEYRVATQPPAYQLRKATNAR